MDNECSVDLKLAIIKNKGTHEVVLPNQHRRNTAENAIRMLKNQFLSDLVTCNTLTYIVMNFLQLHGLVNPCFHHQSMVKIVQIKIF